MLALNEAKIFPGVHYRDNILYKMYAYANGSCPNASRASDRLISLPMHMNLSNYDINRICDSLKKIVEYRI
jgi:dTDP-4-amino-4,6-dideoxygalactose transaminase